MKNLNTVIFNSDLTVKEQSEKPIQAFSSFQNIVRAIAPFGTEFIPFAIFHATNDANDVGVPAQSILMLPNGTVTVNGEDFFVYEQKVPEAVVGSLRATKVEFVLSLIGKKDNFIGVQRYDETDAAYIADPNAYIAAQLLTDFPDAEENDYVRVFNTETDWEYDGTAWTDTDDQFESILEDFRSEIVEFALYKGKSTGKPTHKPNNTESIIEAINLKVSKTGDTMTGSLQFPNANQTRLILGNNNITTEAGINSTTFKNGEQDTDAVKFSNFATLFDVSVATPGQGQTFIDTIAAALTAKFAGILSLEELADFFLPLNGSSPMTGSIDVGGNDITNVGDVDGVDVSQLKTDFDNHGHPISDVTDLQTTLNDLSGNISALSGAFIFRGVISNTTAQVEADTTLLDTRIDTLLGRTAETGDVLKDSEGGEWYYDGSEWRFMGQASIDLTQFYTKNEADAEFADINHTHTESDITDLDKYTQAEANALLDGKADTAHGHVIADVTDLQTELDGKEPTFTKNTAFNKDFGNTADTVTEGDDARLSDARTPLAHDHVISDVTDLQAALDSKPTIDGQTGKIPASVIPLQFEDVLQGFYDSGADKFFEESGLTTEIVGEEGKLYIDIPTNRLFRFDGTGFIVVIDADDIQSINDIPDVVITNVANDQALVYNTATDKWENQAIPRTVETLEDTTITTAANGEVLIYNGSEWVNADLPTQDLDDLTDVEINTPVANHLLVHDGTNFVNQEGTRTLVGLNNVENYGIASQAEAEDGTETEKYMTPLRTAQAIAELSPPTDVSTEYAAGVIEENNNTNTNFWTGTQAEYDALSTYDNDTLYFITG